MIVEKLKQITEELCSLVEDAEKAESGNKSAGRRVRKSCMEITKEIKSLRSLILESIKE